MIFSACMRSIWNLFSSRPRTIGDTGEDIAARYLEENGYVIVKRNFTTSIGEIDIVARDADTLCFVEVKSRSGTGANPLERIDRAKRKKISDVAEVYLKKKRIHKLKCRFDAIAVNIVKGSEARVNLVKGAFDLGMVNERQNTN